jgi:hypothetical protein
VAYRDSSEQLVFVVFKVSLVRLEQPVFVVQQEQMVFKV